MQVSGRGAEYEQSSVSYTRQIESSTVLFPVRFHWYPPRYHREKHCVVTPHNLVHVETFSYSHFPAIIFRQRIVVRCFRFFKYSGREDLALASPGGRVVRVGCVDTNELTY